MDEFFGYVSKGVIIIPIIITILALILRFNQTSKPATNSFLSPTPTTIINPTAVNKIPLDLDGPWVCHYENNQQEYSLFIKDKKISLEIKAGGQTKKYDLSSYAPIIENMLVMDINQLENLSKQYLPKGVDLKTLIKSCKKI